MVLKGPTQSIVVREKQKVAGISIYDADSAGFRSAPSYYAVASSRPIRQIVDEKTAAIYEFGLRNIQLSPIGAIDPAQQARFAAGLTALKTGEGLYKQAEGGVKISEQVSPARITLPSSVPTGTYTAETFAISKGWVVASATSRDRGAQDRFRRSHRALRAEQFVFLWPARGGAFGADGLAGRPPVRADLTVRPLRPRARLIPILTEAD